MSGESLPAHLREAMTDQMTAVVEHQLAGPPSGAAVGDDPEARMRAARAEYRRERAYWNVGGPRMAGTDDLRVRAAGVDVPIRIHRPSAAEVLPAITYFHGGGFTLGDLDTHDRIMRVLAQQSGCAVVGVDYSLSPEARFPRALHECAGVVAWLTAEGEAYDIASDRLVLAGDSAGAALALGVTLLLRDEPHTVGAARSAFDAIRGTLLYYGAYGLRDSASGRLHGGFWDGLAPEDRRQVDSVYFADPADRDSPYADLLAADLASSMPAALVVGAELDPLADDSRALADLLGRHGHDVEMEVVPGVLHSFLHFGRMLDAANEQLAAGAAFARARL